MVTTFCCGLWFPVKYYHKTENRVWRINLTIYWNVSLATEVWKCIMNYEGALWSMQTGAEIEKEFSGRNCLSFFFFGNLVSCKLFIFRQDHHCL